MKADSCTMFYLNHGNILIQELYIKELKSDVINNE